MELEIRSIDIGDQDDYDFIKSNIDLSLYSRIFDLIIKTIKEGIHPDVSKLIVLILEIEKERIGFIFGESNYLEYIFVSPKYRGLGCGSLLLQKYCNVKGNADLDYDKIVYPGNIAFINMLYNFKKKRSLIGQL
ncbi:GNAT family N-acetyltransferase [Anabaena cylindrica FACHB-243]|uniref:N-acetyltransferase domain-containing protein n=1 Tax=Anabaena cylindrica (strain ATCC 27899 / PCC 7122) TaxID=272123 RepID=K9ZR30_ANACC|nr:MULTISPECIES: GNAT family N-acetyltransferase [Anabaena]AFZ60815.1 hypothetical protein Anacy_5503 [Anabaena cylindrica PCC 7122]MBD2417115.1 GNAT family N-acetyltransferase [Anabaena cylindrica FACHB-243]MBY5280811.1 GNAT family N-acetyltransferase [Anabaena sp. CCAP 1446/1C]MBY5307087.1 GNAT family N-acetyltransferase [Anabaena sp. CCAP 1446/1C]MCM2406816.1 GNAT family N-acetyltransferase [Anabaena sp. CCAP 1446/1C]